MKDEQKVKKYKEKKLKQNELRDYEENYFSQVIVSDFETLIYDQPRVPEVILRDPTENIETHPVACIYFEDTSINMAIATPAENEDLDFAMDFGPSNDSPGLNEFADFICTNPIINVGLSCWMGSVLQAIIHLPILNIIPPERL